MREGAKVILEEFHLSQILPLEKEEKLLMLFFIGKGEVDFRLMRFEIE